MYISTSGGARSRNLGGHLRGNTHFGRGQDRISRNLPSPSLPKFLAPWIFFHTLFPKFFPGHFQFFSRPLKIVPAYQNFSQTYQKCIFYQHFINFYNFAFPTQMFQQHLAIFHKSRPSAGVVPTPMALSD